MRSGALDEKVFSKCVLQTRVESQLEAIKKGILGMKFLLWNREDKNWNMIILRRASDGARKH